MVRLKYFARLKEALGVSEEEMALDSGMDNVAALVARLRERGGTFAEELAPGRPVRVAVNYEMAGMETLLRDGDEVAFFPPVTGG